MKKLVPLDEHFLRTILISCLKSRSYAFPVLNSRRSQHFEASMNVFRGFDIGCLSHSGVITPVYVSLCTDFCFCGGPVTVGQRTNQSEQGLEEGA